MRRLPPLAAASAPTLAPTLPRTLAGTLAAVLVTSLGVGLLGTVPGAPAAAEESAVTAAAPARKIDLTRWDSTRRLRRGNLSGTRVAAGRVEFDERVRTRRHAGTRYDVAHWTSPWRAPGFSFTNLIASWSARTPGDSWVEIQVRGRSAANGGSRTNWDTLGRWAASDRHLRRSSVSGQDDDGTSVNVDTWRTGGLASYQVRVALLRRTGTGAMPSIDLVTAMTSRLPTRAGATSRPGPAAGKVLAVPRYSQMIHRGHYPAWGNGGEAWCSPTSTSMVLGYYGALPKARAYRWVPRDHTNPWVDYAARMTYDHDYDGTGNWPFNTAYAAPRAGKAFVTRLRSLREAERFIVAGIPLVVSIAFDRGELDGAPISSSGGHLLVIRGFNKAGDVVVNDPAAANNKGVRRTYRRDQLEKIWLEASGGLTYVIHDAAHPLPESSGRW
ncbi:C39 family peptidase [Nocardioides sambongensis]|uniref:C39 family peptidase n=1 Tax=Nocardioides sambongensis TaxID=2589074 RepID=UPI00112636C7|nr:C39 family peptidase [Nocardioides sambongensis]